MRKLYSPGNTCTYFIILLIAVISIACNAHRKDSSLLSADDSVNVENYLRQSNQYLLTDKAKANSFAQQALLICADKNNNFLTAKTYTALSAAQRYNVSMDSLFVNDKKAMQFARLSNDTSLLLNASYDYAKDLVAFNELIEAKKIIDTAMQFSSGYKNDTIKSKALYTTGLFSFKLQSNLPQTEKQFQRSLIIAEQQHNKYLAAFNKMWIFQTHVYMGQYDSTIKLAFEALNFFSSENDQEDIANCETIIGDSYRKQGNMNKAIEFFTKAYPLSISSKNYIIAMTDQASLNYSYVVNNDLASIVNTLPLLKKYALTLSSPFLQR